MIEAIRSWLLGIMAASLFLSVCQRLIPEGSIRKIAGFTGGLILLSVMLQPLLPLRWELPNFERYRAEVADLQEKFAGENEEKLRILIASETEAYISDKAASLGLACTPVVTMKTDENGNPVPASVRLRGEVSEALLADIRENLALPCEREKGTQ